MKIQTKIGFIERSELSVTDEIQENDNDRATITTWVYKGDIVRQDVNINILRSLSISGEQAVI